MQFNGEAKGRIRSPERGGASVISLVTVLAAFLLGSTYLYLAQSEQRMTTRAIQATQSVYLAEAGLELARAELARNPSWRPLSSYSLGTGTFYLTITPNSPGYTLRALGKAGQASRTVEIVVNPVSSGWKVVSYKEVLN